ncbi:MAG: hypothetical protein AABW89_00345 [Nanoarchaeota archaeon]
MSRQFFSKNFFVYSALALLGIMFFAGYLNFSFKEDLFFEPPIYEDSVLDCNGCVYGVKSESEVFDGIGSEVKAKADALIKCEIAKLSVKSSDGCERLDGTISEPCMLDYCINYAEADSYGFADVCVDRYGQDGNYVKTLCRKDRDVSISPGWRCYAGNVIASQDSC